jgi:hypothetical protein
MIRRYVEAPDFEWEDDTESIFLAGSITNAWDWQAYATDQFLLRTNGLILNPRRKKFDISDLRESERQITWEFCALESASLIFFWFSDETLAPISLFELGRHLDKNIVVGCDRDFLRKEDVKIQVGLARPDVQVFDNLSLAVDEAVRKFNEEFS